MKNVQTDSLIKPSIDNLLTKVENKYVLSLLAARRARELFDGDEPLIDEYYINKVTMAINEIDQGKVTYTKSDEPAV
ncbi:MAG: DNA-directed RNA polymerase subunit omega [Anaerofustis sp.]|jgi:DNA-directed RNA polymerase subunit omega